MITEGLIIALLTINLVLAGKTWKEVKNLELSIEKRLARLEERMDTAWREMFNKH